jgi:hypothetical protein
MLVLELTENKVEGEPEEIMDLHEEKKEELDMPQKVFLVAKALLDDQKALDHQ